MIQICTVLFRNLRTGEEWLFFCSFYDSDWKFETNGMLVEYVMHTDVFRDVGLALGQLSGDSKCPSNVVRYT